MIHVEVEVGKKGGQCYVVMDDVRMIAWTVCVEGVI